MTPQITALYPHVLTNNCLEVRNDLELKIVEPHGNGKCQINNLSIDPNFLVRNPDSKDINFLAIDGCVFTIEPHKRCDCAVYDDSTFCFVEIKDSDTTLVSLMTRQNHLTKAYQQLEVSINLFTSTMNFTGYNLEAIVSFREKPPIPAVAASDQYQIFHFFSSYNVSLSVTNVKTFSGINRSESFFDKIANGISQFFIKLINLIFG